MPPFYVRDRHKRSTQRTPRFQLLWLFVLQAAVAAEVAVGFVWLPPQRPSIPASQVMFMFQLVPVIIVIGCLAVHTARVSKQDSEAVFGGCFAAGLLLLYMTMYFGDPPLSETRLRELSLAQIVRSVFFSLGVVLPVGAGLGWVIGCLRRLRL